MARLSRVSASRSIDKLPVGSAVVARMKGDVDRERLVEQPLLAIELDQPDEILGRRRVDLAAALARVDEGAQAHLGEGAGLAGGDVAIEVRDAALRQVVSLDPVLDRKPADLGDQPPMPADDALQEPVMAQPVQPLLLAVPLPRREQQGQVARLAGRDEALLQADQQIVRRADADEARGAQRVAAADQGHRLGQAHDLVAVLALAEAALVAGAGRHGTLPQVACGQLRRAGRCPSMAGSSGAGIATSGPRAVSVRSCHLPEIVRAKIAAVDMGRLGSPVQPAGSGAGGERHVAFAPDGAEIVRALRGAGSFVPILFSFVRYLVLGSSVQSAGGISPGQAVAPDGPGQAPCPERRTGGRD